MAFEATSRPGYVKTGEDGQSSWGAAFSRWSNAASYIPYIGSLPAMVLGAIGTGIESLSYLFKGQILSAGTALAAGSASTFVNSTAAASGVGSLFYWGNVGSGLIGGRTAGSLIARKGVEEGIGLVTGVLGVKPRVLQSNFAAIGNGPGVPPLSSSRAPGQFTSSIAAQRGQDADAYWAQKQSGEAGSYVSPSLTGAAARA